MFRKIIINASSKKKIEEKMENASSNLKRSLHLGTKIKSNRCLHIGTDGVSGTLTWCVVKTHVTFFLRKT